MARFNLIIIAAAAVILLAGCIALPWQGGTPTPAPTATPFVPTATPEPTGTPAPTETPTVEPTPEPSPYCGDGILDLGEMCERGIPCPSGLFCTIDCRCVEIAPTPTPEATPTPEVTPTPEPTPTPTPEPTLPPPPLIPLTGGGEGDAPTGVVWLDYLGAGYGGFRVEIDGIVTSSSYDRIGVTVAPGERLNAMDPDALFLSNGPTGTPRNIVVRLPYMQTGELWSWRYQTISGAVSRRSMSVVLMDARMTDTARYDMTRAWPYGYTVNVDDGRITETLYIAVESVHKSA